MFFFGKRWVFAACLIFYAVLLGTGIAFLNHQYGLTHMANGPQAAFAMSAIGGGVLFLMQTLMTLALFVRLHTTQKTMWWILPALVPFVGIPFLLVGVLGDSGEKWNNGQSEQSTGGVEIKPLVGIFSMLLIAALGTVFMGVRFYGEINANKTPTASDNGVWISESAKNKPSSNGKGIPNLTQRISCYDEDQVNTIGQSGWVGNCAGMLIVDNATLKAAGSFRVEGNETFYVVGPDGNRYTFVNSRRTIFTGQVTDLSFLFANTNFNGDIRHWNTSNVVNMSSMFAFASEFNQNLGAWDTSNVLDMSGMFESAEAFNDENDSWGFISWFTSADGKNISDWNTSKVKNMRRMFAGATTFNQPIKTWNTSSVTNISEMFSEAYAFDQDLETWNTSNIRNMSGTFESAKMFNGNITTWNVSKAANLSRMFYDATNFNQDISIWNTSSSLYMSYMFGRTASFNAPIGAWNTSNVIGMDGMFAGARSFNQPIGGWNLSSTTDTSEMFENAIAFNQPIGGWNTSKVKDMERMFFNAETFNQDIGSWNTSMVESMDSMFENAALFNQNLSGWATSVEEQPYRFANGTPQAFRNNSLRQPTLLGEDGPGTGERFNP